MSSRRTVVASLEATVHRVLDHLAAELSDLGLTAGEVNVLAALEPAITVSDLQAATGQRASTLTGILDRLERRGLIVRALNPRDRRSFTVDLTDAGAVVAARIRETFAALERRAARAAGRQALDGFYVVLDRLDELTGARP